MSDPLRRYLRTDATTTRDLLEQAVDREDALVLERRGGLTRSEVPSRCKHCGEWSKPCPLGACVHCRGPFR